MANEFQVSDHNFEQCMKCSICTAYCPVTPVNQKFPGPKQGGPDGERYRLKDIKYFDETLKYCLNCKRCEVACPSNVKIGDIIQVVRIKNAAGSPSLRDRILANTDIMGTMASAFAPVVNFSLKMKPIKKMMDATLKIDSHRQFPSYTGTKFTTWFNRHASSSQDAFDRHVAYFHGCYVNYNFPKLGKDLVKILNAVGIGVRLLEKEKCCGVAMIMNRLVDKATKDAKTNLKSIRKAVSEGMPVLATSTTCSFTIRDEYNHILGLDNLDVRDSIMLATRYLYDLVEEGSIKLVFRKDYKKKIAYHTACHMEKLGWAIFSSKMLEMIPGVDLTVLDSTCCGIAGTYGFKKEYYPYSQEIGKTLFDKIAAVNPDYVSTDCETCKWQIEMSTPYKVENPISTIADALDVEETKRANHLI